MTRRPYGLICPISLASGIIEPRWTLPILTELWNGSTRFNDIRKGVGGISSAILSRRLKELETLGLVERIEDKAAGTVDYIRTERAIRLEPAMNALAEWAQRNIAAEAALTGADASTLMWALRRMIVLSELPRRRAVIRFHFRDEGDQADQVFWLVAARAGALPELCTRDPGLEVDLYIETSVPSLGAILEGRSGLAREVERGGVFLSGDAGLVRTMDRWLRVSAWGRIEGIAQLS